jgi:hypothetical protein
MRNHPYVNSRPNEIAHDSKNIQRGMIMNMFESDQEKTLNRRPASGTVKDGTNEQDKHIDLSVTTPETDSIVSFCSLVSVFSSIDIVKLSLTVQFS